MNELLRSTCCLDFITSENFCCICVYWEKKRLIWSLKTGSFWGTESLQKRRWASVAVPPRRKCSTNANGCWENVYALTFHLPIPPRRQANRPSQQALGIHLSPLLQFLTNNEQKPSSLINFYLCLAQLDINRCPHRVKGRYMFARC